MGREEEVALVWGGPDRPGQVRQRPAEEPRRRVTAVAAIIWLHAQERWSCPKAATPTVPQNSGRR